ncbi:hypothetical protein [Undibacterium sp. Di24W]|uniref:hypothetical protein n=1 Tax=Undibacterium sp. Di24W TaxID=3413033 RepID=UPI003BF1039D
MNSSDSIKFKSMFIALTLTFSSTLCAQSLEQAREAAAKGDHKSALASFKKLAEQGNTRAQLALGGMYAMGVGTPADTKLALTWFQKAAELGDRDAPTFLGVSYYLGEWLNKDDQQAALWFAKGVKIGDPQAKLFLDIMPRNASNTNFEDTRAAAPNDEYSMRDIGTLGGKTCHASAINEQGQVVGYADTKDGNSRAFMTGPNGIGITALATPESKSSYALGINAGGQVVGHVSLEDYSHRAFITAPLGRDAREVGAGRGISNEIRRINNKGQVILKADQLGGDTHLFIVDGSGNDMKKLPEAFKPSNFNDNGTIIGTVSVDQKSNPRFNAALLNLSTMQIRILGSLLGNGTDGNFNGTSFAYGINASGQIVGKSSAKGEVDRAFITNTDGKNMRDLGSLRRDGNSQANNINSSGQVVGWSATENFDLHAFVTGANGNNMRDLNSLVKKPIGIVLEDAESINDKGQIIAKASNGFCFLLTPRPTAVR